MKPLQNKNEQRITQPSQILSGTYRPFESNLMPTEQGGPLLDPANPHGARSMVTHPTMLNPFSPPAVLLMGWRILSDRTCRLQTAEILPTRNQVSPRLGTCSPIYQRFASPSQGKYMGPLDTREQPAQLPTRTSVRRPKTSVLLEVLRPAVQQPPA